MHYACGVLGTLLGSYQSLLIALRDRSRLRHSYTMVAGYFKSVRCLERSYIVISYRTA